MNGEVRSDHEKKRNVSFYRNWIGFFLIGTINNLPYVVVNSSAKVLASSFHEDNLVTLVMFSNVAFGLLSKGSNTLISMTRCPYWIRFVINGCFMAIGILGVAFAPNFWIALIAIVFAGTSSSFGENLTLGLLGQFPKECINAWSSGTGLAGLLGASLYLGLSCIAENTVIGRTSYSNFDINSPAYTEELKKINRFTFLGTLPVILVYWLAYFFVIKVPVIPMSSEPDEVKPLKSASSIQTNEDNKNNDVKEKNIVRILRCSKLSLWLSFNMICVYFFEYTARGFAAKSRPQNEFYVSELHCPELFASLQLCYQAGVLVSRSSVQMFQIKQIGIFTLLQLINVILWIFQAWWKFLPVYVLPSFMIYVGLLGGASYVNIFYLLRTDPKYPEKDRELCTNLVGMSITIGVLLGTASPIPLFKTLFKNK